MEKRLLWYTSTANRHEIYVNLLLRMINRDLLKSGFSITDHFLLRQLNHLGKERGQLPKAGGNASVEAEIEKNIHKQNPH